MASLPEEQKVDFLIYVLSTFAEFKPDYTKIAARYNINNAGNAQRRLKGIIEKDKKFSLVTGRGSSIAKVVENDGDDAAEEEKPKKKRGRPRKDAAKDEGKPKAKKSKEAQVDEDEDEDEDEDA